MGIELRFLDLPVSSLVIQRIHLSERSFRKCDAMLIDVTGATCCLHQQYAATLHKTSVHAYPTVRRHIQSSDIFTDTVRKTSHLTTV
jgi:hypothetical protein